jgi:hypothetical protein
VAPSDHQNGTGFNIVFKAMPLPGTDIVMLERKEKEDSEK